MTLYQYTRGLTSIPDDVNAEPVTEEMRRAKSAIDQAVELGYYQAARESAMETVTLGDSDTDTDYVQVTLFLGFSY